MASTQSMPAMQAGGSLPPGLTPQQVQETYAKFKRMQEAKVPMHDPEFIKCYRLLSEIQRSQQLKKASIQQQQQQQQQRDQSNPAASVNGVGHPARAPQGVNGAVSQSGNANSGQGQQVNSTGPANSDLPGQHGNTAGNAHFSADQLNTLRHQIYAFKLLSRNKPIPPMVQQQLFHSIQKQATPGEAIAEMSNQLDAAVARQNDQTESAGKSRKSYYETFESPYSALASSISYSDHMIRSNRLRIPSLMPSGIDLDQVREEKERVMYNRIQARRTELASLPANIASWNTTSSETSKPDDSVKLKAMIEYKALSLLQKQRDLRRVIQREVIDYDNLAMTSNRSQHRRMKKQSIREARITEKLEKQQRDARETKEKQKQSDHLTSILKHGEAVRTNAQAQRQRNQKLGRMMVQHHQTMEREEQKRIERTAKQRLQALKANDEETYMKLLGQAKDSRISHLLKQTDGFLKQLAASVREQQRNTAEKYGDEEESEEEEEEDEEGGSDDEGGRKVDYYAVAHRIKEPVTIQPSILIGGTLKEYQLKGLQWMISLYNNNLNGILADEMGLGKTIQTISLVSHLIEKKRQNGPFLVIVPLSTLTNWNLEFEKWAPSISRVVYKGPPNARKQQQQRIRYGSFQVLLTTYEYIIKDRPILSKIKWLHMIVDEGHRMKNAESKLSSTLTQYYTTRYRLILTGTPLQNNLPELWALLNFVLPTIFKSVKSFDEWFNTPFANTGGQDRMELSEEEQLLVIRRLHKVLRPFLLRRLKKDVEKDLPDKQERVIKCRFSALQAKLYKQLMNSNRIAVSDGKGGKTGMRGLSNMLMQLRKLCNHPFVFEAVEDEMNPSRLTNDLLWRTAGKFELLDRILPKFKASGHRVLMFFQMTQIMNIMEDFLRLRGLQYLRLDGSTKSDDRSELLRMFNAPGSEYFCFLLSTRAGGLGLNLQSADTVVIYDSDWNPHQDLQAQDRAHRIGQKNEVRILRLISSNSVEEKILERAQFKLDMDGKVIQAGKFDNKSTNEERDALLRTLLESAEAAEQAGGQEEMEDDDLNEIMARNEDELQMFQNIDRERMENDQYGPGHRLGRLIEESELPEIYLAEDNPVTEEVEEYAGRGARERKVTKYDDGLTEEQWLMAVDADDDTIEDAIARKEARIDKRRTNKEKRSRKAQGAESSPEPSRESSMTPQPKKRGRKPGVGQKRKLEEPEEDTPVSKKKKGKQSKTLETLNAADRQALQKVLNSIYDTLMDLETEDTDPPESDESEEGTAMRAIIGPFVELPDRRVYHDYYVVIQNPIAMQQIKKKIDSHHYQGLAGFRDDIRTLCNNARAYNEDGSLLYLDANLIEQTCNKGLEKAEEDFPQLADDGSSAIDGRSTRAVSSVGTPLANTVGSGPKLKLNFNRNGDRNTDVSMNGASGDEE
ncbi:MAG: hypothetical protein Q9227_007325 [Pyrenula ochraceoflavens]